MQDPDAAWGAWTVRVDWKELGARLIANSNAIPQIEEMFTCHKLPHSSHLFARIPHEIIEVIADYVRDLMFDDIYYECRRCLLGCSLKKHLDDLQTRTLGALNFIQHDASYEDWFNPELGDLVREQIYSMENMAATTHRETAVGSAHKLIAQNRSCKVGNAPEVA